MSEGEKIQFTGNLALLRVCAIVYIVNVLKFVFNMSFMAGHGGFFSSLWSALTNSSFEDLLATVGLLIVSGIGLPVLLGVLVFVVLLALGVFAIVKNNVMILKILAVLLLIWVFASVFIIIPIHVLMGDAVTKVDVQNFINMVFNVNVVVAVAAFFVASKKHDESGAAAAEEPFNLGLFRLCAIFFIVSGLNSLAHFVCTQSPLFQLAFFGVVYLAVGVFALVKKNVPVLVAGSLMILIHILFNLFNFIRISGLDSYMAASLVSHAVFNTSTVIAVAVFFIKPEWVKGILQKIKG